VDGLSWSLVLAAAGIGLTHTLLGPDHYLPFIMLSRARRWSTARTAAVTAICGLGHVLASVALGAIGIAAGIGLAHVEAVERARGSLAAWALVAFGGAYAVWGVRRALRRAGGIEPHDHHGHVHLHRRGDRPHDHGEVDTTFWTLFAVFVLGPCEPLIPLVIMPASRGRLGLAGVSVLVFGVVTVGAMIGVTLAGRAGLYRMNVGRLARWSHAMAGGIIATSGLSVIFLGL